VTTTGNANQETTLDPAAQMNAPAAEAEVHPAEFPEATQRRSGGRSSLERFSDVQVDISVEIGRVTMSIGDMLQLGPGSVVELDRDISEPVTVMAQGVRIASGEVVVINDRFAVRITEVSSDDSVGRKGNA
jgi:flagellar motor switch protein FliN/FliY